MVTDNASAAPSDLLNAPAHAHTPRLWDMAGAFLVIGALAFGGQSGLLALLNRNLAERRGWVTETEITEAFTYVQLLPGPVVAQVVAYLGWKLRGTRGTLVATIAFLAPSVSTMILLGAVYQRIAHVNIVRDALGGLTAAVVGLIAVAIGKQGRKTVQEVPAFAVTLAAFTAAAVWRVNPALLVAVGGGLGILREALRKPDVSTENGAAVP